MNAIKKGIHMLHVLAASLASYSYVREHCPHCDQETLWAIHTLRGFHRCTVCGKNPLSRGA